MASLDNLGRTTALPLDPEHLHASLEGLQWTVKAYNLDLRGLLLLTGATLGERYGRRRLFTAWPLRFVHRGLGGPPGGALHRRWSPGYRGCRRRHRDPADPHAAVGGGVPAAPRPGPGRAGAPSAAWPSRSARLGRRGCGGRRVLAVDLRPGRADRHRAAADRPVPGSGCSRAACPLDQPGPAGLVPGEPRPARHRARRRPWQRPRLDQRHRSGRPWSSARCSWLRSVRWDFGAREPMLPPYRSAAAGFAVTNLASLLMFFGMFGSIFLLAQFLQVVQHYSPLQALPMMAWTATPVFIAPVAGALSDVFAVGAAGHGAQPAGHRDSAGWPRWPARPCLPDPGPAFVVSGVGMSLFFAPVANVVLSSVRRDQEGIASGANNAIRQLGGVFVIAVLARVFFAVVVTPAGLRSLPPGARGSGSAPRRWPSPRPSRCSCPGSADRRPALPRRAGRGTRSRSAAPSEAWSPDPIQGSGLRCAIARPGVRYRFDASQRRLTESRDRQEGLVHEG